MKTVKRFDPLLVMRIAAIFYAAFGLLEGLFLAAVILPLQSVMNPAPAGPQLPWYLVGILALIAAPLAGALVGAIFGALGALTYNASARWVGGIAVEVTEPLAVAPPPL